MNENKTESKENRIEYKWPRSFKWSSLTDNRFLTYKGFGLVATESVQKEVMN